MARPNPIERFQALSLQTKTGIFVAFVLMLITINYIFVRSKEVELANSTSRVEVAQRNKVISQKFGFLAFSVYQGNESYKKELEIAINEHQYNLDLLENGGTIEILGRRIYVAPVKGKSKAKLNEIKQLWTNYREKLLTVLTQPAEITQLDSNLVAGQVTYTVQRVPNQTRKQAMNYIQDNTLSLFIQNGELSDLLLEDFYNLRDNNSTQFTLTSLGYILIFTFIYWQFIVNIVTPIRKLVKATHHLVSGNFSVKLNLKQKDEIGRLAKDINKLADNLQQATNFATAIGNHQFEIELPIQDKQNQLAQALINMRDNLKNIEEEAKKRDWISTGIALFNDILRKQYSCFEEFAYAITYNMVNYLKLTQMGFYSLLEDEKGKKYLKLEACYAYDRRRFEQETIDLDDGLLAQAVLEKATIYLTEVPENYIRITSGLGDAPPRNILIVPLTNLDGIFGAIEIASFQKLKDYEIEFIQKVAENTATTIANIRINERSRELYLKIQEDNQCIQAQEEELRQNLEELISTQEILQRREKETQEAYQKLTEEYERKVSEMTAKERILSEQKSHLQALLEMLQENYKNLEKQYQETQQALEKLKNKEASMAFAIQEKDKEIITLRKTVEELRKGNTSS